MALRSPQLQKFLLNKICGNYGFNQSFKRSNIIVKGGEGRRLCSAIAIDAPASIASVYGIRWGSVQLKGAREEMEDDAVIIQSDELDGFSYAAVFDGHAGFSSVQYLKEELYRECYAALQGNKRLLSGKDFKAIKKALQDAFESADAKLLNWLEKSGEEDEFGATATVVFLRDDMLFVSHVSDSCLALSRSGKAQVLTDSHRHYIWEQASLAATNQANQRCGWLGFVETSLYPVPLVTYDSRPGKTTLGPDAESVVLASDGLWDYMSSSDVINFIRNQLCKHGDVQMASEALEQVALDQRSQDNISIIIADLRLNIFVRLNKRTDWQNLRVQKQNIALELVQAVATVSLVSPGIWMSTLM